MKKKIYIFDFDHTLFNAKEYRFALGRFIKGNENINSEEIWSFLKSHPEEINHFMEEESKKYIFGGVREYLEKLKDKKILLTHGDVNFQQKKIEASGILELFDSVYYVDVGESKLNFLREFLLKNQGIETYFINDNYNLRHKILENDQVRWNLSKEIKVIDIDNYGEGKGVFIQDFFQELFSNEGIVNEKKKQFQKFSKFEGFDFK